MSVRAVKPGERAEQKKTLSVSEAAANGSRRDLLVAMRDRIAVAVASVDCPPRDLASLTRRLQDIAKEIEALDVKAAEDDNSSVEDEEWEAI